MRNKKTIFLSLIISIVCISSETFSQGFDEISLIGVTLNYNLRKGTLDFGNNRREEIGKTSIVTSGFVLGKRWRILPNLRLQISANIKYGSGVDDTMPAQLFTDGIYHVTAITTKYLYTGCVVDFQVPLSAAPGSAWYAHVGGGGHIVDMSESMKTLENPPSIVNDPYLESLIALSTSIHAGLGFEILLSPRIGFAVDYSVRYWYPVHYGMTEDLFPNNPVHYHERFISHELDVLLLVKRR